MYCLEVRLVRKTGHGAVRATHRGNPDGLARTFSTTTSAFTAKVQFDLNVRGRPDELQAVTANSVHEDNATASVAAASTADGAETVPPSPKPPNADRSAFSSP